MDHTYVDSKNLKTLEDYAIFLASALLSLVTLQNLEIRAIEIGIMKEDMAERSNTMIWDSRRLMKLYKDQLEATLELLPEDFNHLEVMKKLQAQQLTKARSLTRRKKCDT